MKQWLLAFKHKDQKNAVSPVVVSASSTQEAKSLAEQIARLYPVLEIREVHELGMGTQRAAQ